MRANEYLIRAKSHFDRTYSLPIYPNKGAAIVETRCMKDFGLIVKNHLFFLPKDYGLTVFHSNANEEYVKYELRDVIGVNYQNIGSATLSESGYNSMLTSNHFWSLIPYEKVLIFQCDSLLLRHGIEQFEQYDYIGAAWKHIGNEVGNGGLSLRSVDVMKRIIATVPYIQSIHGNEDIFFSKRIKSAGGFIASNDVANMFSVETTFYPYPVGVHAADKWLTNEQLSTIYNNSLRLLNE